MHRVARWALILMIVVAGGCGDAPEQPKDTGEKFLGNWVATNDSTAVMHIAKEQDGFVLTFIGNAQGHGLGRDPARGVYKDGILEVARAGLIFRLALNANGQIETGFTPKLFRRIAPGETLPKAKRPTLPKL